MAEQRQGTSETAAKRGVGEWFWRFLATVMTVAVAWVIWIAIQISPRPLVTPAAYEAAAQAKARTAQGVIAPAPPAAPEQEKTAPEKTEQAERVPPVNIERLRMSESLATPPAPPHAEK